MEKVCSSKRDAAFTSSQPTEFVMYDRSKPPLFPRDIWPREPGVSEDGTAVMWLAENKGGMIGSREFLVEKNAFVNPATLGV